MWKNVQTLLKIPRDLSELSQYELFWKYEHNQQFQSMKLVNLQ